MKLLVITRNLPEKIEEVSGLLSQITNIGYRQVIIPIENRDIHLTRDLLSINKDTWIIFKEVEDTEIGNYLYSCSQIIGQKDKVTVVFYDIFARYIPRIDLNNVFTRLKSVDGDIVVVTKSPGEYKVDVKDNLVDKFEKGRGGSYSFIGISLFSGRLFKWVNDRYGLDPSIVYSDLDEVLNQYLYNGHKLYAIII